MRSSKDIEKINNFKGTKRQKLTAVRVVRFRKSSQIWLFNCECGGSIEKVKWNFLNSNHNNCGCRHGKTKHGFAFNDRPLRRGLYNSWVNMRQRCNNPRKPDYPYYGGRGIRVCEKWNTFAGFLEDMQDSYEQHKKQNDTTTLDRINSNGDYSPENCRWATRKVQARNRPSFTHVITYNGKSQSLEDWAIELGQPHTRNRLYERIISGKWEPSKAFNTPYK